MAEIRWTGPALADLEATADFIALQDPAAARALVQRTLRHVRQLADHPHSGSTLPELGPGSRYRQIIEPPLRVVYRVEAGRVLILHVMRTERLLRRRALRRGQG